MISLAACTFFGHRDAPDSIYLVLRDTITDLIENHEVNQFYVGEQGHFDHMVKQTLYVLQKSYPWIHFYIVSAYRPPTKVSCLHKEAPPTLLPFGLENVPPRYAIVKRNEWMINQADYVVMYVTHSLSNTSKLKALAEKKKKHIITL